MTLSIKNFRNFAAEILSSEINQVEIEKEAQLSIALVYPNYYKVAIANLGFQTLYRLLNNYSGVRCERACIYESFPEMTRTLESAQQLIHFDVIAFSISFEMDYLNVIKILKNTGLNPFAKDRHPRDPLLIAGGAATFINPEPIAPFFDIFFLGEVEPVLDSLIEHLKLLKINKNKINTIGQLAEVDGIYAPQFFDPSKKVKKISTNIVKMTPQFSPIVTSQSHFQNMFLIEIGRGCGRYCRFCTASHVYHPVRFFKPEKIITTIEKNINNVNKIGLVGAALCDYPKLTELCENLVGKKYKLGLSSFRFETISQPFLEIIQQAEVKTITLAPEAGTERLRKIINKPISNEHIQASIELIAKAEISNLRLYFLIGLPYEEQQDVNDMIELVKQIRNIFFSYTKKRKELVISINAFIPKPFTPFQWCAMNNEKDLKKKRRFIENELIKISGIKFTRKSTRAEILQCILSLGDQQIANNLISMTTSKHLYNSNLLTKKKNVFKEKFYHDPLPWDFIANQVKKERLWREWQKAKQFPSPL